MVSGITLNISRDAAKKPTVSAGVKRKHAASDTDSSEDGPASLSGPASSTGLQARRPGGCSAPPQDDEDAFIREMHMTRQIPGDHSDLLPKLEERALRTMTIDNHWPFCQECNNPPASASQETMLGDGVVQSFPTSEAAPVELSKLGGWLRCTECTAALHFRCLDSKRQKDILKDVNAEREDAARKGSRPARWETLPADVVREDIPCMTCYNQPALCYLCGLDPVGRTARAADEIWGAESEDDVTELGDFARPVFRCRQCKRFAHYECLAEVYDGAPGSERAASLRAQLLEGWKCPDCFQWPEVEQVVAWRPASGKRVTTIRAMNYSERREKLDLYTREYLVKFRMMSWRSAAWVPHLWLAPCWPLALRTFLERRPSWVFAPDCVRYTPAIPEWTGARYRTTANMDKWELLVHNPAKPSEAYSEDKQRHTSQGLHGFAKSHKRGTAMDSSADARIPVLWKTPERVLDVFYRATIISSSRVAAATVRSTEESLSELGKRPIGLPPNHLDGLIHIAQLDGTRIISPADAEKSFSKVAWALVKWQGLEYEDASWIEVTPSGLKDADYAQQLTHAYSCHLNARDVLVRSSDPARLKKPVNGKADMDVLETINNRLGLAPYQRHAVEKMVNHWTRNQTSILTDDAGMGKTVEITGLIAWLFNARQVSPFLILVPRHTIRHWLRTLRNMLPAINTVALQGPGNVLQEYEMFHSALPDINHVPGLTNLKAEVVIADPSEPSVAGARDIWARCWELLVIHPSVCGDEGSQVAALVKCPNRIILNDTLLTASELPGVLKAFYPIPSPRLCDDASRREEAVALEKSMTQAWIHNDRTKLLERSAMSVTELVVSTGFQASQRAVFQSYLNRHHDTLQELCSVEALSTPEETTESIRGALFDLFSVYQNTFLCADKEVNPQHVPNPTVDQLVKGSAKLLLLLQILRQLHRGGHRTVVVSPRTLDLDVIEEMVLEDHYRYMRIDRDSRPEEIDLCQRAWNQNGAVESVFLLHSHAFSADMNLIAADTVIFYGQDLVPMTDWLNLGYVWRHRQNKRLLVLTLVTKDSAESHLVLYKQRELARHAMMRHLDAYPLIELSKALRVARQTAVDGLSSFERSEDAVLGDGPIGDMRALAYTDENVERLLSLRGSVRTQSDIPEHLRGRITLVTHGALGPDLSTAASTAIA